MVVALTIVMLPAALASSADLTAPLSVALAATLVAKELTIGLAIAVLVSVVFWGVEMAGSLLEGQRGRPLHRPSMRFGGQGTALGDFTLIVAVVVFLVSGGHLVFVSALADSYTVAPVFALAREPLRETLLDVVLLAGQMFTVAMALALPAVVAVWMTDLFLGLVQRATPRMQAVLMGLPLRSWVGLIALLAVLHVIVDVALDGTLSSNSALEGLLR